MTAKKFDQGIKYLLSSMYFAQNIAFMTPNSCVLPGTPKGEGDKDNRTLHLRTP